MGVGPKRIALSRCAPVKIERRITVTLFFFVDTPKEEPERRRTFKIRKTLK